MTGIEPVAVPAASELVTDRLRRAIHLGTFAPGEQLPTERALAASLGVSRVTLREALHTLADHGYIVTRRGPHGGSTVTSAHGAAGDLRRGLVDRITEFDEITEFRHAVETGAARLAARSRDEEQLATLRRALDELAEADSVASFRRADSAFHLAVAAAAGNALLAAAVEDARQKLFGPTDALPFKVLLATSHAAHTEICTAIAARDGDAAARAMAAHVDTTRREFRAALGLS